FLDSVMLSPSTAGYTSRAGDLHPWRRSAHAVGTEMGRPEAGGRSAAECDAGHNRQVPCVRRNRVHAKRPPARLRAAAGKNFRLKWSDRTFRALRFTAAALDRGRHVAAGDLLQAGFGQLTLLRRLGLRL